MVVLRQKIFFNYEGYAFGARRGTRAARNQVRSTVDKEINRATQETYNKAARDITRGWNQGKKNIAKIAKRANKSVAKNLGLAGAGIATLGGLGYLALKD